MDELFAPTHVDVFDRWRVVATPNRIETSDFNKENFSARGSCDTWRGFVFVNLDDSPVEDLSDFMADKGLTDNWPLEDLRPAPGSACGSVQLEDLLEIIQSVITAPVCIPSCARSCRFMQRGFSMTATYPTGSLDLTATRARPCGRRRHDLDHGWQDRAAAFEGLTDQERDDGLIFMDIMARFIIAHADYVRTVRLVPRA